MEEYLMRRLLSICTVGPCRRAVSRAASQRAQRDPVHSYSATFKGFDQAAKLYKLSTAETVHESKALSHVRGKQILKCLLSPDVRQLATASADKTIKLWNLDGFTLDRTLTGHGRWVWDCVFSVDAAYLVSASSDCTAKLWDLASGDAIRTYNGHHKAIVCCALNDSAIEGRESE